LLELNGIALRGRVMASASLAGYGAPPAKRLLPYGLSPIAQALPLRQLGAVTTRTLTLEPREGHFTTRTDWRLRELPGLFRRYGQALRPIDAGWLNAFGWANIGLEAYLRDYFPRTHELNRIVSVGGFSAAEFTRLVAALNERIEPGQIAGVEFNVSCHNVNFPFEEILEEVLTSAVSPSRHPILLKLSPDTDYLAHARLAQRHGVSALTAVNTVKGLRLDPDTGRPLLRNGYGGMSGRCIKPIALRVIAELREAGVQLPIVATGGIRNFDDAREFFWAGADVVSLGSAAFLTSPAGYAAAPLLAARLRGVVQQVKAWTEASSEERPTRLRAPAPEAAPRGAGQNRS
jgi:dihydroorotate dehydrogenase (NAD+) catalytic subunit